MIPPRFLPLLLFSVQCATLTTPPSLDSVASLLTARDPSARASLAAALSSCAAGTLAPPSNTSSVIDTLLKFSTFDSALALLACSIERGALTLTAPLAATLVFESCARKSVRLLAASITRANGILDARDVSVDAAPKRSPSWTPLHAAISNNLHVLTLTQDVLKTRPLVALGATCESMSSLVRALSKYNVTERLGVAARALGVHDCAPHLEARVSTDGSLDAGPRSLQSTVELRHLRDIANALSSQLVTILLSAARSHGRSDTLGRASGDGTSPARLVLATDDFQRTPLHVAATAGALTSTRILLAVVADAAATDWRQAALLQPSLLSVSAHVELALSKYIEARDVWGLSAVEIACDNHFFELVHLLSLVRNPNATLVDAEIECASRTHPISLAEEDTRTPPVITFRSASEGWGSAPLSSGSVLNSTQRRCDFDVVDAGDMTASRFMRYYVRSRPVLIRRAASDEFISAFHKDVFLERAGHLSFSVSKIPYAKAFSEEPAVKMSLSTFVRAMEHGENSSNQDYVFEAPAIDVTAVFDATPSTLLPQFVHGAWTPRVEGTACNVRCFSDGDCCFPAGVNTTINRDPLLRGEPKPQLYVGPAGSGAPLHIHKDALNILAAGKKQWYLFTPAQAMYSTVSVRTWVAHVGAAGALSCEQEAGDAVFVPRGFAHAVFNRETVVGVALEFSTTINAGF